MDKIIDSLQISIFKNVDELGKAASIEAAEFLKKTLVENGVANLMLATGNSQLSFLKNLRVQPGINWSLVKIFHMDEYLDIVPNHPASFRSFIQNHFLNHLVPRAEMFYPVPGNSDGDPSATKSCQAYETLLKTNKIDLCVLGFGENGHLAFNDPPYANFNDSAWVKVVKLDEISRRQQVGEGHFPSLNDVPTHAITLTIPALLSARKILAIVPEARKAKAVKRSLHGPIEPDCPGSILRNTTHAHLFLDNESAALAFPDYRT